MPTEQQWQRAAQGDDARVYPWGNEWDCTCCHNSVKPCDSKQTSAVTAYADKGNSPFSVIDMAGNVSEWTLSEYETAKHSDFDNTDMRVLRGGSWDDNISVNFRVTYRNRTDPKFRCLYIGFRLVRS